MKPVNLNTFRKSKARADAKARSDENAIKFGRSKAEKASDTHIKKRNARLLDGHCTKADDT